MLFRVSNPSVQMMTSLNCAKEQFLLCAFGAGISHGKFNRYDLGDEDCSVVPESIIGENDERSTNLANLHGFDEAESLMRKLLDAKPHKHESVLEHGQVTFLFKCSRIASHEIVRHRIGVGITQMSTRYCWEHNQVEFIRPPHCSDDCVAIAWGNYDTNTGCSVWLCSAIRSLKSYEDLNQEGNIPVESARYLLPHCLRTYIAMTFNFRAARHFIDIRGTNKAAPEIRYIAYRMREELLKISSVLVEDLPIPDLQGYYK